MIFTDRVNDTLDFQQWLAVAVPCSVNIPDIDLTTLSRHILCGEVLLSRVPVKPKRTLIEQQLVDKIHLSCRQFRRWFMSNHAIWLYDRLTKNRTSHLQLSELAYLAAESCPGLVPTKEQMKQEESLPQAEKEGREIDQGIFFWGLLRQQGVGFHLADAMLKPTVRAEELIAAFSDQGQLDLGTIEITRRDSATYLTIQNNRYLNSEDNDLIDDLETAVDLALMDDKTKVAILRGGQMTHPKYHGQRVFSAGINLKHLHQGKISFVEFLLRRELGYISKIKRGLLDVHAQLWNRNIKDKPWIAAVDSFAIGGGAQLLLVFDKVLACVDSYFSLPAAQEGIIPGLANFRLAKLTGARMTRQIILSGRKVLACEPDAKLLIDEIVESSVMDAAIEMSVAQLSSPAVKANRRMINFADEPMSEFCAYMAEFSLEQSERLYSKDVLDKKWG